MKNIFWELVKINVKSQYSMYNNNKKYSAGKIVLFASIFILAMFTFTAYTTADTYNSAGLLSMVVLMGLLYAVLFIAMNTMVSVSKFILGAKDYEFLISMPIKKSTIVLSKLTGLLVLCYLMMILGFLPFLVMYYIYAGVSFLSLLYSLIILIVFPLFPLSIAYLLWLVVGAITRNVRNKQAIASIFSVLLIFIVIFASLGFNDVLLGFITNSGQVSFASVVFYPLILASKAICYNDLVSLLIMVAICVVPTALMVFITQKYYTVLNYIFISHPKPKKINLDKPKRINTPFVALVKKEFQHLFNSTMYLMNSCIGAIFIVIGFLAFGILYVTDANVAMSLGTGDLLFSITNFYLLLMLSISNPMTSSISIDGHTWWQAKSLPVTSNQILWSKMTMYLIIFAPCAIFATISNWIFLGLSFGQFLIQLLLGIGTVLCFGLLGLIINLKKYNFNWTNEMVVAKQSMPVLLVMLIAFAFGLGTFLLYIGFLIPYISAMLYWVIITSIVVLFSVLQIVYLQKQGKRIFEQIEG